MNLLNLGCGNRFHPAWTNVDFVTRGDSVIGHDLRKGIPFPTGKFDVVYHSHLLEHFPRDQALSFLQECRRVMTSGGIIRIAVPDLECIARLYLEALEKAAQGDKQWQHHYEWIMLELYDQTIRERPGGELITYLRREVIPNKGFVLERWGIEAQSIIEYAKHTHSSAPTQANLQSVARRTLLRFLRLLRDSAFRREWIIRRMLGAEYELLQLGRFRRGGEIHLWMYDRYSLAQLLEEANFQNPQQVGPTESQIPGWIDYHLDTEPDGSAYKPDSLYMEAVKP